MTATEVFLDQLRANGCGDLVNVSSVAGRVAPAGFAAYAATKWGINGWSEALRVELQPDVRSSSLLHLTRLAVDASRGASYGSSGRDGPRRSGSSGG